MAERQVRQDGYSWLWHWGTETEAEFGAAILEMIAPKFSKPYHLSALYRSLRPAERSKAHQAYRRLLAGQKSVAFVMNLAGREFVHHVQLRDKQLIGYLEEVQRAGPWRSNDILSGVRSGSAARAWLSEVRVSPVNHLTLMLVGIADIERINSQYSRDVGNSVLSAAGERIRQLVSRWPGVEMIARIAGRDFMIAIGEALTADHFKRLAEDIVESFAGPTIVNGREIRASARVGIATGVPNESGLALLRRASLALSKSLTRGSAKIHVAASQASPELEIGELLDADLAKAITNGQVEIVLQPQFRVADGKLVGAEALARWNHPIHGLLGADALFAAADRCDMREQLSESIQLAAMRHAASWSPALSDLRLSINLGALELGEGDYSSRLEKMIADTGFCAKRLTVELTEEGLVRNLDAASGQLSKLREKGIRVALDDFGTGYSSLIYLKNLPVDYLKLDKGMTPDIRGSGKDRALLRSIIALGKAIGLQIIAEGVEHPEELEMLQVEGCDIYQGYFRSRPLSPQEFERFAMRSN